jgi:hypothetical protein
MLKNNSKRESVLRWAWSFLALLLLIGIWLVPTQAQSSSPQNQAETPATTSSQTLEIEKQKLAFEREKIDLEKTKAWLTAGTIVIPFIVAILTVFFQLRAASQLKKSDARTAFELKAAEIVLSSGGPKKAKARAQVLKQLFPDHLPENFAESFDPSIMPGSQHADKLEFLKLAMEKPEKRDELIKLWEALFPWDDAWLPKD